MKDSRRSQKFDERKSQVIELRFFGGLSVEETAAVLNVSVDTVMRDWKLARQGVAIARNAVRRLSSGPRPDLFPCGLHPSTGGRHDAVQTEIHRHLAINIH